MGLCWKWLGVGMCVWALVGCDRYAEPTQCRAFFEPGQAESFVLDEQGTALDGRTGLRWFRCHAGERFAGGQCLGQPLRLSQADAEAYAQEFALQSGHPWRLPTRQEMRTLRETRCVNPALNTAVFPSALVDQFRTSSPSRNGPRYSCTMYTFNGHQACRESALHERPFLLVLSDRRP
jgi:hypothetical protein